MSANLSNFAVYVVDDNFFNGEWLKKRSKNANFRVLQ